MPVQALLGSQQHWLSSTAGHTAAITQLAQAVLHFESSRSQADFPPFEQEPEQAGSAGAAQLARQALHSSWQRYEAVLQQMQGLHQAYLAADGITTAANGELAGVHQRRIEALAVMQSAQVIKGMVMQALR